MTNFGSSDLDIKVGDRIAQIMFLKTEESLFEEVSELGSTAGGAGGFGSTNYKLFLESRKKKWHKIKTFMILVVLIC